MPDKKEKKEVKFALKNIELLDFSFKRLQKSYIENSLFHFDIKLEHKINKEKNLLFSIISIGIFNEKDELELGSITASCVFEIQNLSDYILENNKIDLPEHILFTFNSITISTARGMMFTLFRGTYLHNALLPIVDPKAFIKQE